MLITNIIRLWSILLANRTHTTWSKHLPTSAHIHGPRIADQGPRTNDNESYRRRNQRSGNDHGSVVLSSWSVSPWSGDLGWSTGNDSENDRVRKIPISHTTDGPRSLIF